MFFPSFCSAQDTCAILRCTQILINPPVDPPHWPVDPWNSYCGCSTLDLSSCHPPVTPISGTTAYCLSPDLEFFGTQAVLPSIWVIQSQHDIIMTHPALHYSSFLALLILIMPPYQFLTNHLEIMVTVLLLNSWLIPLADWASWHHSDSFCFTLFILLLSSSILCLHDIISAYFLLMLVLPQLWLRADLKLKSRPS